MSRIYFHSPEGTAEVLGAERAHAGLSVQRIALGAVDAFHNHERLRELINPRHDMARADTSGEMIRWAFWFERALASDSADHPLLAYGGNTIRGLDLILNTALAVGSDAVKLMARIDGQCELHGYVEGPNRAWLASIIDQGLADGVMRPTLRARPLGWDDVTTLLRAGTDTPVVMSYSVTDWFPNEDVAEWQPPVGTDLRPNWASEAPAEWAALDDTEHAEYARERVSELWGELPKGEQWQLAMAGLRARSERGALLELKPDSWAGYRFGHALTVFDLYSNDWQERIETALGIDRQTA